MAKSGERARRRVRFLASGGFVLLVALFFSWALIEHPLRSSEVGGRILGFLERPLLVAGDVSISLLFLLKAGAFLVLLSLLARQTRLVVRTLLARGTAIETGQRYAFEKSASYLVWVLGLFIGLQVAGINLSSLTVIGGALGIGIGFGLQQSANNLVSGIILLLEQPIKVGDRVEVGTLAGDVVRIGSRATWVRTNDNIDVIVPNSEFVSSRVINWTATDRQVRFSLKVGVSYKADPREVEAALLKVAGSNKDVLRAPAPDVLFMGFGDSALNFELRVWSETQVRTPAMLRSSLYYAIFAELAARGIEIPFPQRDVHVYPADGTAGLERQ